MESFETAMYDMLTQSKYDLLTGRVPDFTTVITNAVTKILSYILNKLNLPEAANYNTDIILYIFMAFVVVILLTVGVFIYIHFSRRKRRSNAMDDIYGILKDKDISYEDLLARAAGYSREGNYREAVRYRFVAVLYVLNKNNIIYLHPSKTNGQLKRELKNNEPVLLPAFDSVIGRFNYAWFGHKPVDSDYYESFSTESGYIAEEAGRHEKTV